VNSVNLDNTTVTSIAQLMGLAVRLRDRWFPKEPSWGPWFRGHTCVDWKLCPKLYRSGSPQRGIRVIEDEIRQEFIMRAPGLTDIGPQNSWEWYFAMQHFGAPTRLLDWTEGALIAMYFAVRDSRGESDATIWALDPWWLNKRVVGEREVVPPGAEIGISQQDANLGAAGTLLVANSAVLKADDAKDVGGRGGAPLGVWLVKVISITYPGAEYSYFYSFAHGGYTATGNIDENFEGQKYSPTMGVYVCTGNMSVRYREKGWIFDLNGNNIGTSDAVRCCGYVYARLELR
jgi:FRG domain